ncbi:hypothetical protein [Streptomyces sp. NPDC090445]|uniref:hypothetical protein n=1 Tax=Streptomyces sp. NPDC090445 TaxID=3365963 RepID=UPI00380044B9
MWQTNEFAGEHDGRPAAVLDDGSEPKPLIHDVGSGADFHTSTDWWDYDGTLGSPRATRVRAACSCGWRGEQSYPIDWDVDEELLPVSLDTGGPQDDWQEHIAGIEAGAVPLPAGLQELLVQVDAELEKLTDCDPLAALRAVAVPERCIARTAGTAAYHLMQDQVPDDRIAAGLGISPGKVLGRMLRYRS